MYSKFNFKYNSRIWTEKGTTLPLLNGPCHLETKYLVILRFNY